MEAVMAGPAAVLETPPTQVADDDRIDHLFEPAGYRILVEILALEDTSRRWKESGLKMTDETRERERQAQPLAKVLKMGPQCYTGLDKFGQPRFAAPWCKVGDHIMMRPYSGTRFYVRNRLYSLINDDTVEAVVVDVGELERA